MCTAVLFGRDPATPTLPTHLDSYYEGAIGQLRLTTSLCNTLLCRIWTGGGAALSPPHHSPHQVRTEPAQRSAGGPEGGGPAQHHHLLHGPL
jgi:hypothetical protein